MLSKRAQPPTGVPIDGDSDCEDGSCPPLTEEMKSLMKEEDTKATHVSVKPTDSDVDSCCDDDVKSTKVAPDSGCCKGPECDKTKAKKELVKNGAKPDDDDCCEDSECEDNVAKAKKQKEEDDCCDDSDCEDNIAKAEKAKPKEEEDDCCDDAECEDNLAKAEKAKNKPEEEEDDCCDDDECEDNIAKAAKTEKEEKDDDCCDDDECEDNIAKAAKARKSAEEKDDCCSDDECEDNIGKATKDTKGDEDDCCDDADCEDNIAKPSQARKDNCKTKSTPAKKIKDACCDNCDDEEDDTVARNKTKAQIKGDEDNCCVDCHELERQKSLSGSPSETTTIVARQSLEDLCCIKEDLVEVQVEIGSCIPDDKGVCQRSYGLSDAERDLCCGPVSEKKAGDGCCSDCKDDEEDDDDCEESCDEKAATDGKFVKEKQVAVATVTGASTGRSKECAGLSTVTLRQRRHKYQHPNSSYSSIFASLSPLTYGDSVIRPSTVTPERVAKAFKRFYLAACCCVAKKEIVNKVGKGKKSGRPGQQKRESKEPKASTSTASEHKQKTHKKPKNPHPRRTSLVKEKDEAISLASPAVPAQLHMLQLQINGMDCPSCGSRVTRALQSIPSIVHPKVNSFTGLATMSFNPDIVEAEAVAKRVQSLTGFTTKVGDVIAPDEGANTGKGKETAHNVALPKVMRVSVRDAEWDAVLSEVEKVDGIVNVVRVDRPGEGKKTTFKESFQIDVKYFANQLGARDILARFSKWDGQHVPATATKQVDTVQQDIKRLTYRVALAVLLTLPVLILAWAPLPEHPVTYGAVSLALDSVIQLYIAIPIYSSALRSLFLQHMLDMDLLVVMSTTIAYVFSIVAFTFQVLGKPFSGGFFETPALLVTLILLGRLITTHARKKANNTLDALCSLQVETVTLVVPNGPAGETTTQVISKDLVHIDDVLRVSVDSTIPTDGVVMKGHSQADESTITGESLPVEKQVGSTVTAGTINLWGVLDIAVKRLPSDNTVTDIQRLLSEAQESRLSVQDIADRVASWIAPLVLAISVLVFVVWTAVGLSVRGLSGQESVVAAIKFSIAVMVVACPCGIVLCVPMVVVIAMGVSAKKGVLFKSAEAVQTAKDMDAIIFDKTGTLTKGQLQVVEENLYAKDAAALTLALLEGSRHPVAVALLAHLKVKAPVMDTNRRLGSIVSRPGQGIESTFEGKKICGGNAKWLGVENDNRVKEITSRGLTIFIVQLGKDIIAAFGMKDALRDDSLALVQYLKHLGKDVYIVSGDSPKAVMAIGEELGVPGDHTVGGCSPAGKQQFVRELQSSGADTTLDDKEKGSPAQAKRVMFVGDGTNDSLALVQADVGVSLSSGTDIAISAADIVIISPTPLKAGISTVMTVSKEACRRMNFNFGWSLVYNLLAILLAAGAFVKFEISPQFAGLGEMVSILPVVLSAWSLWLVRFF